MILTDLDKKIISLSAVLQHFPSHEEYCNNNNNNNNNDNSIAKEDYNNYIKNNYKWINTSMNPKEWDDINNIYRAAEYLTVNSRNQEISRTQFEKLKLRGLLEKYHGSVYLFLKIAYPENKTLNHAPWLLTLNNPELILKQLPLGYFYNPSNPKFFNESQKNNSINNFIRAMNLMKEKYNLNELKKNDYKQEGLGNLIYSFKTLSSIVDFYEEYKDDTLAQSNQAMTLEEVIKTRNYNIDADKIIL